MVFKEIHNVKKSIYDFIKNEIEANSDYIIGDGATHLRFYDSFPIDPVTFRLPSLSLDYLRTFDLTQYDLGNDYLAGSDFEINIFGRTSFEKEFIANIILDSLTNKIILLKNYEVDPPEVIRQMKAIGIDATPLRIETPGEEQENRFRISFTIQYLRAY